jgi:hypothetical protein
MGHSGRLAAASEFGHEIGCARGEAAVRYSKDGVLEGGHD